MATLTQQKSPLSLSYPWLCRLGPQEQKCPLVLGFPQFPQAGHQPEAGLGKGLDPRGSKPQAWPEMETARLARALSVGFAAPLPGWELYLNSVGHESKALGTEHIQWDI